MKRGLLIIWFLNLLITQTSCVDYSNFSYDLDKPIRVLDLPSELREISGIQMLKTGEIAAVQDEKGNLYFLDEIKGEITSEYDFGKKGDYEGICIHQGVFYVLESNGTIHKVEKEKKTKTYKFEKNEGFDFEGICLDIVNNRLLVVCKDHGKKKKNDDFFIYSFSLDKNEYEKKEVVKLSKKLIHKNFGASGIAIHPNGDLYILSSRSKTLLVLSENGEIKNITSLNSFVFRQPEGITFNKKAELYISNEENNGPPTILVFVEKQ